MASLEARTLTIISVAFRKSFKHVKRMFPLAVGMPYALILPQCDFAKVKVILKYQYVKQVHHLLSKMHCVLQI